MSSVIELYEHNQKAYDALLDMLGERDRACIIKPTGTGKFVIIAKMVQDNPDKRFLLLGTNDYMFNDQMANLAEIAPGFRAECDRRISQLTGRKPRGAGVRACEERVSGMAGTQGRPLYDGLRLHGLGDRYEQHLL